MKRRQLLRTCSASILATAGCLTSGDSDDTDQANSHETVDPPENDPPKSIPDGYYDGPFFSVHEHFETPIGEGWKMTSERFKNYQRWMDQEHIYKVLAFMTSDRLSIVQDDLDWILPYYIEPVYEVFRSPDRLNDLADMFREGLEADPTWQGIGELALYNLQTPEGEVVMPDHPAMKEVYDLGAELDKIVMIHPPARHHYDYQGPPEESPAMEALEQAFNEHRDTTFLIHGLEPGSWINGLLDRHPNWYYDTSGIMHRHFGAPGSDDPRSAEELSEHMTDAHFQEHVKRALDLWEDVFRDYPERVMTGLDLGLTWHHDPEVYAILVELYRAILGELPENIAEQVAYKNAEQHIDIE